jgi:Ca-activated chloride channel homolog
MPPRVCLRSRLLRFTSWVVLVLVDCQGWPLHAQTQPVPSSQHSATISSTARNPAQPEMQPNLAVDRDPVLSPDPEDNAANTHVLPGTDKSGQLQRDQSGVFTLHEDVDEVLLNCTVLDEKGRLVLDLKRRDFRLWENGVPQTLDSFQHQDLPVSMGILVDNSGSMRDKHAAVTAAALDLVRASNPVDAAFVVNFSDKAYLDQNFTSSIEALERGLSHFDSRSTTALYDAVVASAKELANHAKQQKQVVLIITDGADNASRVTLEQAIQRVQNLGGPLVYSIGLLFGDDDHKLPIAKSALETLSRETGGVAYFPKSLQDVDEIAGEVARDIRNQYTIGYHSTKPPGLGGYRTVHVEVTAPNHGKLIVRTRKGYYPKVTQSAPTVAAATK